MRKVKFKILCALAILLAITLAVVLTACSPIKKIEKDLAKVADGNYSMVIVENSIEGIKTHERQYAGDRLAYSYNSGEVKFVFDKMSDIYVDVYTNISNGGWKLKKVNSSDIDYSMENNYAYNAWLLATEDLSTHFTQQGKKFVLKQEYFAKVFTKGGEHCYIEVIDGRTTISAVFRENRADTVRINKIGKTKVALPTI